eukprot:177316_1
MSGDNQEEEDGTTKADDNAHPFIDINTELASMTTNNAQSNQKDAKPVPDQSASNLRSDTSIPPPKDKRFNYQTFHWIFIVFFTLVAVIDRFTINLWPLWVDSPGPTIPGNTGVSVFALIAWISSRMMLVSSSYIFLFQCRVFWNWFCEQKMPNKYLVIEGIHQTNINIHYHVGWALVGVPVVLHVWAIVFAAAFPQNDVKLYDAWMRPKNPDGTSIPFYADNLLSLGINDVYRIVSTSVTFFILIPYSIIAICRNRNWSRAQWIHFTGAMIYTVDLIRMKSHPHCWVFNLPFIMWWMADRTYGIFWYRRCVAKLVNRVDLDGKYAILYLSVPPQIHSLRTIGDVLYVNFLAPKWDRAHPFTVFWNHKSKHTMITDDEELEPGWLGHKFVSHHDAENSEFVISRQDTHTQQNEHEPVTPPPADAGAQLTRVHTTRNKDQNADDDKYNWDVAIIMQVFPDRKGCDSRKTWTKEVVTQPFRNLLGLRVWGPYRSEYRVLVRDDENQSYPSSPLVLIGTGCGCSYLVDFFHYISSHQVELEQQVYIYFSTRSMAMFQWFTDITCKKSVHNLSVNAHLTSAPNVNIKKKKLTKQKSLRDSKIGRLDMEEIFEQSADSTQVYYCGSPSVQNLVHSLCRKHKLTFHAGHSFY